VLHPEEPGRKSLVNPFVDRRDHFDPLLHIETAKPPTAPPDRRLVPHRLRVEEDGLLSERGVQQAQGVNHDLRLNASQRPAAKSDIESLARHLKSLCPMHRKANAGPLLLTQQPARLRDALRARIKSEHKPRPHSRQPGQSPLTAANVQHPTTIERHEPLDRRRLNPIRVSDHSLTSRTTPG
jgi:hypothetical protein